MNELSLTIAVAGEGRDVEEIGEARVALTWVGAC